MKDSRRRHEIPVIEKETVVGEPFCLLGFEDSLDAKVDYGRPKT